MAVIKDIKDGDLSVSAEGTSYTRIYLVTELSGAAEARLYNVLLTAGVPRYGEPHPVIPGLFVIGIVAVPDEAGAKVTVTYGYPTFENKEPNETAPAVIQVGSTLQESTTSKDKDDILIKTTFVYTPVDDDGNQGEQTPEDYVPSLSVQVPMTSIEYQRRENNNPIQKSMLYVGKVNSVGIGAFAPRTLLCTGIEGGSNDGGITYDVSYRFQYEPKTWDATYFFIDPDTGQPHKDVKINPPNGYGVARLYDEIDMRPLNVI